MREIKFRAWDKERGQFYTNPLWVEFQVDLKGELTAKNLKRYGKYGKGYQQLTIIEYTGMRDMNDTEIWEGDICKLLHISARFLNAITLSCYVQIRFNNGQFEYYGHNLQNSLYIDSIKQTDGRGDYVLEVIGNIYENPELLVSTDTKT